MKKLILALFLVFCSTAYAQNNYSYSGYDSRNGYSSGNMTIYNNNVPTIPMTQPQTPDYVGTIGQAMQMGQQMRQMQQQQELIEQQEELARQQEEYYRNINSQPQKRYENNKSNDQTINSKANEDHSSNKINLPTFY